MASWNTVGPGRGYGEVDTRYYWLLLAEGHHFGVLFPHIGLIVTNLSGPNQAVVRFYNKGGTRSSGKQAVKVTPLSFQGATKAELDRLQPRESVAAAGAADAGRHPPGR